MLTWFAADAVALLEEAASCSTGNHPSSPGSYEGDAEVPTRHGRGHRDESRGQVALGMALRHSSHSGFVARPSKIQLACTRLLFHRFSQINCTCAWISANIPTIPRTAFLLRSLTSQGCIHEATSDASTFPFWEACASSV